MLAVFKREFKAYFTSPIGYVVLAIFLFFSGMAFSDMYASGYPDITYIFSNLLLVVMVVIPVLTMRSMSEDRRLKIDQALFTAPVSLLAIVMGKFLAALAVFSLGFSVTLIFQIIISFYVTLNWMVFIGNILGILLFGAALIAVGIFVSALTESQMVAAITSFAASFLLIMLDSLSSSINISAVTSVIEWISFGGRYDTFVSGMVDYANIIFFLSFTAVFIFLTVRVLDKKRWA